MRSERQVLQPWLRRIRLNGSEYGWKGFGNAAIARSTLSLAKHSRATGARVLARVEDGTMRVEVRDDGIGGARPVGSGFLGLTDRLAVLDGHLSLDSPAGGGTLVVAEIPLGD